MPSKSFSRSTKIVGTHKDPKITGTINIPSEKTLDEKTVQELSKLKLQEVQSDTGTIGTLGLTFNDGKSVKSGSYYDFN